MKTHEDRRRTARRTARGFEVSWKDKRLRETTVSPTTNSASTPFAWHKKLTRASDKEKRGGVGALECRLLS